MTLPVDGATRSVSPQALSRVGGVLYLVIIALGLFGEVFVRSRAIVPNDAAATAANLRSMESMWRLGIAGELILLSCAIALLPIFYVLLRPVSRHLVLLAVSFNLVAIAVEAASALYLLMALFPLGRAEYLAAFEPGQLHALTRMSIRAHAQGFGVSLLFFGWFCVVAGHLIHRSGYLPKAIGVLMQIAGVSYLINSFALILAPDVAARLFPFILLPPLIGETSLAVWLLAKGVNVETWHLRARAQHV